MNVTLKIDDDLCREARHRAIDADMSLSKWVAHLVEKEIVTGNEEPRTIAQSIQMDDDRDLSEFIPKRSNRDNRDLQFP